MGSVSTFLAKIIVTLRPSILDPQGKAVHNALKSLNMQLVEDVRIGKYIEIKINTACQEEAERIVKEACTKLLANPIMEDYSFTVMNMTSVKLET